MVIAGAQCLSSTQPSSIIPIYLQPLISQSRIFPCSFPTANHSPFGLHATALTLPNGVPPVGQFLYTVQLGKCTSLNASLFHRLAIHSTCPSPENSKWLVGVTS